MKKAIKNKQQVNDLTAEKSRLLVELGQEVYLAYRRGEGIAPLIEKKGELIKDLDSKIYSSLKEAKSEEGEMMECTSCGAPMDEDDLFCQQCGKKADEPETDSPKKTLCYSCGNEVPAGVKYCNVCGVKM
ncbi:zinc ribbon domain-containing protein [Virgibacillus doumboii]|uniref:zinc ribbon domain-containing protein n=1 Tax=Virgibacillus doumboii TaxID=2697503 RepID=UPI0013DFBD8A|nr:zinc ribbon domain-containing protein [Virgibacillus doumboii]